MLTKKRKIKPEYLKDIEEKKNGKTILTKPNGALLKHNMSDTK